MGAKATFDQLGQYSNKANKVFDLLKTGVRSYDDVERMMQLIIEGKLPRSSKPAVRLYPEGFTPAAGQIANQLAWDAHFGHILGQQRISAMAKTAPNWDWDPAHPLRALVLCASRNTLVETILTDIAIIKLVYGEGKVYVSESIEQVEDGQCSLPEGAPEFVPNHLWWEVVDFGVNRNKAPDQVPAETAAGLSVFAAACQHPAAVRRHNGSDTPYWDVSGLRVIVPGGSRPCAPCIRGRSDGSVGVRVRSADDADPRCAGPVGVRE